MRTFVLAGSTVSMTDEQAHALKIAAEVSREMIELDCPNESYCYECPYRIACDLAERDHDGLEAAQLLPYVAAFHAAIYWKRKYRNNYHISLIAECAETYVNHEEEN